MPSTLYEIFFDMTEDLCKVYPALSPFIIRKTTAHEVFLLVRRINRKADSKKKMEIQAQKPKRILVNEFTATGGWY